MREGKLLLVLLATVIVGATAMLGAFSIYRLINLDSSPNTTIERNAPRVDASENNDTADQESENPSGDEDVAQLIANFIPPTLRARTVAPITSVATAVAPVNNPANGSTPSPTPRVWSPAGRFTQEVFTAGEIDMQYINYGTQDNFAGGSETISMTVYMPSAAVDSELDRPLIVAMTGGDTAGFCDSTLTTEQAAMQELAQWGYVTVALTPLLDPAFCDGEPAEAYYQNMQYNLSAAHKALDYLYENKATFGIDSEKVALYGYSIGGQTALFKLRTNYINEVNVAVIAGFAAIAPDNSTYNSAAGNLVAASASSPDIFMMSFEPDTGYGPGVNPDARADCENLVTLGYDCTFFGLPFPSHPVHANSVFPGIFDAREVFYPYLKQKLVD